MASYHPTYGDVWNDERLGDFECRAFFVFLFSHHRVRPSGIYRATDEQLAVDTGLPGKRIRAHLGHLAQAGRIVRDGSWIFVVGYLKRQPKGDNLLKGVKADVLSCTSEAVLDAFGAKYQLYRQWSADRRAMVGQRSANGRPTVSPTRPAEQLQSRAVTEQLQSSTHGTAGPMVGQPSAPAPGMGDASITPSAAEANPSGHAEAASAAGMDPADVQFILACPEPYQSAWVTDADWWVSLKDGYPGINLQVEASKYLAHHRSQPKSGQHKDVKRGFRNWIATEARWRQRDADRQAQAARRGGPTR